MSQKNDCGRGARGLIYEPLDAGPGLAGVGRMNATHSTSSQEDSAAPSNWSLIRRLAGLAWQYRWGCIKVILLQIVLLSLGLLGLGFMGLGVDYIRYRLALPPDAAAAAPAQLAASPSAAAPALPPAKPPRWPFGVQPPPDWPPLTVLAAVAGAILLMAAVRSALNIAYTLAINRLVQGQIVVDLRSRVYDKMQRLSFRFFDGNASSSLINRVTGDVQSVRGFVDGVVVQSLILGLSLAVYLGYMIHIHAGLTLASLATTPLLWFFTRRFSRLVQPAYAENRQLVDRTVQVVSESVQGIQVVKGFGREAEEVARFAAINRAVRDQKRWIFRQVSSFQPLIGFLTQLNLVVMLAYGGWLVVRYEQAPDTLAAARAGLSVGQLLVFTGLLQQFSGQVASIANIANTIQQSLIGARRVFEVLDTPVEIRSPPQPVRLPRFAGRVQFENVDFAYTPGEPVLKGINLTVAPGECVALLGTTGAGKSTLLSLIPRFYDPPAGRVLVDGVDVRQLDLDELRRAVGLVFQESFLFSNTVAANIAFGHPSSSRAQIEAAARIAAAHDFILRLPQGYDTLLREGGANLSGGQRQRLAIARAFLKNPPILILDEATSDLDAESEFMVQQALADLMKGRTVLVIAHRLATIRNADRIVVIHQGRVAEVGRHEELLARDGLYRRLYALQVEGVGA